MGSIKTQIDTLMKQEMDRRDFLKYSGSVLLAFLGISGIIKVLLSSAGTPKDMSSSANNRYGTSRYGK